MTRMRPLLSPELFGFLDVQELIWTALTYQYEGRPEPALACYETRAQRYAVSGMPRLSTWRLLHHWGKLLAHLGYSLAPHGHSNPDGALGPLRVAAAVPFRKQAGDRIQKFQFQIGTSF